jgi:uncharacterized Fe-S radical SAM superfamily protein PflX
MSDLAQLRIWDDPAICGALAWYLDVAENRRPAKFRIAATVAGEDFSIRHLVMPNHVECCTYPVLDWIADRVPAAPVSVMAQFHPDNFCDPTSAKYRGKYAEIARRPTQTELDHSWRRARELDLKFEAATFEHLNAFRITERHRQ